jgi:uncharacterized glyoxalase superfamily protein PhnB
MTTKSATASVRVDVDPATAFRAFTEEIDRWWVPGPINAWDFGRALTRRIEPGVGGRVLEVYDGDTGDGLEIGRITLWEPGSRLVYRSSIDETEVEVRFAPAGEGTEVRVVHSVLPGGDIDAAALFWPNVLRWLVPWCRVRHTAPPPRRLSRLAVGLHYQDPPAAARWLADVFGLRSWDRVPEEGERPSWIELHVGDVAVLLFPADGKPAPEPVSHNVWVYVDDLDAHFAHATARGAAVVSGLAQHGYRSYTAEDLEGHRWTFVQASPAMRGVPW